MSERRPAGAILLDKPPGLSSFGAIARLRPAVGRKVGHAGTLDPFATGLLVVCCGRATRLATFLSGADKRYVARIRFGATSSTGDPEGEVAPTGALLPSSERLLTALDGFRGTIEQVPPAASAIHVDGERAYRRFRRGEQVEIPSRTVTISALELLGHDEAAGEADVEIRCSTGTYVRALARDLGDALGCGAYLTALRRTGVGGFDVALAAGPNAVLAAPYGRPWWLQPAEAVAHLPALQLDGDEAAEIRHGRRPPAPAGVPEEARSGEPLALLHAGRLIAVGRVEAGALRSLVSLG